ncbi:type I 3-dehydroquinate dehydratase [Pantoea sp.]|uniref:type I 3-dehydroquinate dehydratase n=1 Tax=Pantoea sp. TaxID=69393 RepID=UPI002896F5CC|nr:type I 3-dehydroquinate dehydratase [Pantoea sp.]
MHRREFIGTGSAMLALTLMSSSSRAENPVFTQTAPDAEKKSVKVKNIVIGEGQPKVIVPTTASRTDEVIAFVKEVAQKPGIHVVELRLDNMENGSDAAAMAQLTHELSDLLQDKLLLATFRTKAEGGKRAISDADYAALYRALLNDGRLDLLDIEMFRDPKQVDSLVALAHQRGVYVIMSSHDFHATPDHQEIIARLRQQQAMGADILKLAAMPKNSGDVLTLLNATWEMHQHYAQRPLLTMSMGGLGAISRMSGELTGSALTFASEGQSSAPGQIKVKELNGVLGLIHQGLQS